MVRKIHLFCLFFLLLMLMGNVSANEDSNLTDVYFKGCQMVTSDLDMYYKDGSSFNVKILEDGKGIVGESVNITINTKTYNLITNKSGEVKLNIGLNPGVYNFKTDCILDNQKLSVINKVKVKLMNTTLIGDKNINLAYKDGKYSVSLLGGDNSKLAHKTVTFSIVGKEYKKVTDENGVASLPIILNKGSYAISAKFQEYGYSTSFMQSIININIINTKLSSNAVAINNRDEYYSVKLSDQYGKPIPDHLVIINVEDKPYAFVTDKNGDATLKIDLPMGIYKVSYVFQGTMGYTKSSGSIKLKVDCGEYNISSNDFETFVDSNVCYLVSVKGENNTCPFNINLNTNIYQDGKYLKTIGSKIYEDGIARIQFDLAPGTYTIKNFLKLDGTLSKNQLLIKPAGVVADSSDLNLNRKGELYTVTFKNNETNGGIGGRVVSFTIKGVTYNKITNEKGEASLPIGLSNGNYQITYLFRGGDKYSDVSGINVIYMGDFKLDTELKLLNSEIFRKGTYYKVKLTDSNGLALKNQAVYVTVKGVSYKCLTDSEGMAKLKIGLLDGDYMIKAEFKGNSLFKQSSISNQLSVHTAPNFNYTLDIPRYIEYNGFKCTNIREFHVTYNGNEYKLACDEDENGFYRITDKKSYLVGANGLESNYQLKQGIEFKINGDVLQMIFHGRSPAISQFTVIFSYRDENQKMEFVIDNEVVATVVMNSFFFENEFNKLLGLGYYYNSLELINSTFNCDNHEMKRSVQLDYGSGMQIKGNEKYGNFDTIQSYLIDYEKISDAFLEKELNKAANFNENYDEYAYRLYLSALMTISSADVISNNLAGQLNVTWDKKLHVVLVNFDWLGITLDSYVPCIVEGDENNTFKFRVSHGIMFSYCEEIGLQMLGNEAKSTIGNIVNAIYEGENFVIDERNGTLALRLVNSTDKIVIDMKTGITSTYTSPKMMELLSGIVLKGSYTNGISFPMNGYGNILGNMLDNFKKASNAFYDIFSSLKHRNILSLSQNMIKGTLEVMASYKLGILLNPVPIVNLGVAFQTLTLEYRNKYAPDNTWQYFSSHGTIYNTKTIAVKNPITNYVDYIEIPYDDNENLKVDEAIYIDSVVGKRNLTDYERNMYLNS